jgi:hypothetical protein
VNRLNKNNSFYDSANISFIDSLYEQLEILKARDDERLNKEPLRLEMDILSDSLDECFKGSPEAVTYLKEHGEDILQDIHIKLRVPFLYSH